MLDDESAGVLKSAIAVGWLSPVLHVVKQEMGTATHWKTPTKSLIETIYFLGIHGKSFQVIILKYSAICLLIHVLLYDIEFLMFENKYYYIIKIFKKVFC